MTEWEQRDEELSEAVIKAAKELWVHQKIRPTQLNIPLGDKLWVTIGLKPDESPAEQDPTQPGQVPEKG